MRNFLNSVFMSKKKRLIRPAAFLNLFCLRPINARKKFLQQWMLPDTQPRFCKKGWTKSKIFFAEKIVWFRRSAKQTDATLKCHIRGIVAQHVVTVEGVVAMSKGAFQLRLTGLTAQPMSCMVSRIKNLSVPIISCLWVFRCLLPRRHWLEQRLRQESGGGPTSYWATFVILQQKNSNFNAILFTFRSFWSHMNTVTKIQKSFQRIKLLCPFSPPYFRSSLKHD